MLLSGFQVLQEPVHHLDVRLQRLDPVDAHAPDPALMDPVDAHDLVHVANLALPGHEEQQDPVAVPQVLSPWRETVEPGFAQAARREKPARKPSE